VLDVAEAPSDLVRLTAIPGEERSWPGLDADWQRRLRSGPVAGIGALAPPRAFLLAGLHYALKHRFARLVWGVDLAFLARRLPPAEREELLRLAAATRCGAVLRQAADEAADLTGEPALAELAAALPRRDAKRLRGWLLARCRRRRTPTESGYLLALAGSRSLGFSRRLLQTLLLPPGRFLTKQSPAGEAPSAARGGRWRARLRHCLSLPGRLRRGLFGERETEI
jgi:hypothetical protein